MTGERRVGGTSKGKCGRIEEGENSAKERSRKGRRLRKGVRGNEQEKWKGRDGQESDEILPLPTS